MAVSGSERRGNGAGTGPSPVLRDVTRALIGLHRRYFGRGATRGQAFFVKNDLLIVELRDIFTTVEHTLVERGQENTVRNTRLSFQAAMRSEFCEAVESATGRHVLGYETVMSTHPQVLLEIFFLEAPDERATRLTRETEEDAGAAERPEPGIPDSAHE